MTVSRVSGLGAGASTIQNKKGYKKLEVWQKSYSLALLIYRLTNNFPKSEEYGLKSQLRRNAVSIPSNIAEGYMRQHAKEYIQFLSIALGSAGELETQILIAKDTEILDKNGYEQVEVLLNSIGGMLTNLIKAIKKKKSLGSNSNLPDPSPQTLTPSNDKPEEACGVFGCFAPREDVARLTYFGLHALQHRGQESAGIAVGDSKSIFVVKDMGLVPQVFDERNLAGLQGHVALGHVRYSTTGSTKWENAQPVHKTFAEGTLALAHNGNLVNPKHLKEMLTRNGSFFNSTSDTEVIADLIASFVGDGSVEKAIVQTMNLLEGAYAVALITENKLYAFRDQHGIRPLCIGKLKNNYIISSETCGLDIIGAEFVDDVKPGELVIVDNKGIKRRKVLQPKSNLCIFEFIYFARPDSRLFGKNLYESRKQMGKYLAKEAPIDADIVIGVPDSGIPAAIGFAEESGLTYGEGLIKNRYVGRTFIQPSQTIRQIGIKMKLNPLSSVIKGKRVIVVDDSIVRGNTTKKIIGLIREAGAKEVHVRISSPPYRYPCFYGIDTDTVKELIASNNSVEQIRKKIKADSMHYLTLKSLVKSTSCDNSKFCTACLTGKYPVKIPKELKLSKLMLEKTGLGFKI